MDINSEPFLAHPKVGCGQHHPPCVLAHLLHGVIAGIGIGVQAPPRAHCLFHNLSSGLCWGSAEESQTQSSEETRIP